MLHDRLQTVNKSVKILSLVTKMLRNNVFFDDSEDGKFLSLVIKVKVDIFLSVTQAYSDKVKKI